MQDQDREPVVEICLMAALVDGARSPEEQAQFERIVARLGGVTGTDGTATLAETARKLSSPEARRLAYEMAVSVVYADGEANDKERDFLRELRAVLELMDDGAGSLDQEALSLAEAGRLVRDRKLSPIEITDACLAQIERLEPRLGEEAVSDPDRIEDAGGLGLLGKHEQLIDARGAEQHAPIRQA